MSLRQHEIAEAGHRVLIPFTDDKPMLLGEVCRLREGQRQLDLACGKGGMLCRWSARFGVGGLGVDVSPVFLAAATARAGELGWPTGSASCAVTPRASTSGPARTTSSRASAPPGSAAGRAARSS
jgi:SAM-dependent methyltransferase